MYLHASVSDGFEGFVIEWKKKRFFFSLRFIFERENQDKRSKSINKSEYVNNKNTTFGLIQAKIIASDEKYWCMQPNGHVFFCFVQICMRFMRQWVARICLTEFARSLPCLINNNNKETLNWKSTWEIKRCISMETPIRILDEDTHLAARWHSNGDWYGFKRIQGKKG